MRVDELPLLRIDVSADNEIELEFRDPASGVQASRRQGSLALPDIVTHPESDPLAHGRALREALLSSTPVRDEFLAALNATIYATSRRPLRISLGLPAEPRELHDLSWETLLDPKDEQPLLSRNRIYFFRFLHSDEPIGTPPTRPRALVFIASPERLARENIQTGNARLKPVDVDGELRRARLGLRPLVPEAITSVPGQKGTASLERLLSALSEPGAEPYHILYLVCHGQTAGNRSRLWLDQQDDKPVDAQRLIEGLRDLGRRRPRLVVLASCQSAGEPGTGNEASVDHGALAAIGPKLVQQAGIAAVVAMQGNVYMRSVEAMMPAFFQELVHMGQVERAMAVARGRLRIHTAKHVQKQWRVPVLFSRLDDGQLWKPQQPRPRTAYLAHAIQDADAEAVALGAAREWLEEAGFEVIESAGRPTTAEPWSQRLLEGLGTCDAAVLLLNERALTEADNWVQVEARILRWRHWLDKGFRLIPLCLGGGCLARLQQAPWTLLCEAGVPDLVWTTPDELESKLRELLEQLHRDEEKQADWRLSGLEQRVVGHFKKMELDFKQMGMDDVLEGKAQKLQAEFGLPVSWGDGARWWARAALSKGPVVLSRLSKALDNLVTDAVKEAVKELLGPVQPAWVDIAAAAQLVHLAAHADQIPGSFYLRGTGEHGSVSAPLDWIAKCYAARACGMGYDVFQITDEPSLMVVAPVVRGNFTERLSQIGEALRAKLESAEQDLWAKASRDAGVTRPDPWVQDWDDADGEPVKAEAGNTRRIDDAVKRCVEMRAANRKPVLLALGGVMPAHQPLLDLIQQRFGPVGFFLFGRDLAPPATGQGPNLAADLPIEKADQAYAIQKRLAGGA
jgi:hypothetical protein